MVDGKFDNGKTLFQVCDIDEDRANELSNELGQAMAKLRETDGITKEKLQAVRAVAKTEDELLLIIVGGIVSSMILVDAAFAANQMEAELGKAGEVAGYT